MNNEEKILAMLENLTSRVDQIQATQEQMQTTLTRVAVTQENVVLPKLQLLAEGHETLLHTLARKDRVEALEDEMAVMKAAFKAMSQRISELEKAQ